MDEVYALISYNIRLWRAQTPIVVHKPSELGEPARIDNKIHISGQKRIVKNNIVNIVNQQIDQNIK